MKSRYLYGYQASASAADTSCMNSHSAFNPAVSEPTPAAADDPTAQYLARLLDDLAQGPLNLPCFPDIVPRVRQALDDPYGSTKDIVRIVGTEPRLAARLIQVAGSVMFNPSGRPAPNLKIAVTRLGRELVQSVTTAFMVQQVKSNPALRVVAQPLMDVWEESMRVALTAQALAKLIKVPTEKVFLAGLMHAIGRFYVVVRSCESNSGIDYQSLRKDVLNEWQPVLSRAVLSKWGFEELVCEAVAQQHAYTRKSRRAADLVDILVAAVVLTDAALHLEGDLACTEGVTAFSRLKLNTVRLQGLQIHVNNALKNMHSAFAI